MKSIRLSLIVYFLLLLAVALGAVSWLSYESTGQALAAKEASGAKLREAQFTEEKDRIKREFDTAMTARAKTLESRAVYTRQQLDRLIAWGLVTANVPH